LENNSLKKLKNQKILFITESLGESGVGFNLIITYDYVALKHKFWLVEYSEDFLRKFKGSGFHSKKSTILESNNDQEIQLKVFNEEFFNNDYLILSDTPNSSNFSTFSKTKKSAQDKENILDSALNEENDSDDEMEFKSKIFNQSRTIFNLLWEQDLNKTEFFPMCEAADKVVIGDSSKGSKIIWFFKKSSKVAYSLKLSKKLNKIEEGGEFEVGNISSEMKDDYNVHFFCKKSCLDLISINSTRKLLKDVLFLLPDSTLHLWAGDEKICLFDNEEPYFDQLFLTVELPENFPNINYNQKFQSFNRKRNFTSDLKFNTLEETTSNLFVSPSKISRLVGFSDSVENHLNFQFSDGKVFRAQLSFFPLSNLVQTCMEVFDVILPSEVGFQFKSRFLKYQFGGSGIRDGSKDLKNEDDVQFDNFRKENNEFDNFIITLFSFFHQKPTIKKSNLYNCSSNSENPSDHDFQTLMTSDLHEKFRIDPSLKFLNAELNSFKKEKHNSKYINFEKTRMRNFFEISKELNLKYLIKKSFNRNSLTNSEDASSGFLPAADSRKFEVKNYFQIIFFGLHLVYEDLKLNLVSQKDLKSLGNFLIFFSKRFKYRGEGNGATKNGNFVFDNFFKAYLFDGLKFVDEDFSFEVADSHIALPESILRNPPNIYKGLLFLINGKINKDNDSCNAPVEKVASTDKHLDLAYFDIKAFGLNLNRIYKSYLNEKSDVLNLDAVANTTALQNTNLILHFFGIKFKCYPEDEKKKIEVDAQLVNAMVKIGFKLKDIDCLPFGVALPLRESIKECRNNPPQFWNVEEYTMIGRDDLAQQFCGKMQSSPYSPVISAEIRLEKPVEVGALIENILISTNTTPVVDAEEKNISNNKLVKLIFSKNNVIKEALNLFDIEKIISLEQEVTPDISEQGLIDAQQAVLLNLSKRSFAMALGKAMINFSSVTPLLTESIPISDILIQAKLPPLNSVVQLDMTNLQSDLMDWPLFHQGVAESLKIPLSKSGFKIKGSWIFFNQDSPDSCKHAGFLYAVGLLGHLKTMEEWRKFLYLVPKHKPTAIGLILGLAASYVGTANESVSKLLNIHIPALLPPSSSELNTSILIQTSAIFGIGLNFLGTSNKKMVEVMLNEIGQRKIEDFDDSKIHEITSHEGYSLAAGFALGFITVGIADKDPHLADVQIVNRLVRMISGGHFEPCVVTYDALLKKNMEKNLPSNFQQQQHAQSQSQEHSQCSKNEYKLLNVDVSSPGATVALSLMYLRSNNQMIADKLNIPTSQVLLDYCRPDFLLLRVIGRNLIMFDQMEPSINWIRSLIPSFIYNSVSFQFTQEFENIEETKKRTECDDDSVEHAICNIIAGACLSLGLKYAGTAHKAAFEILLKWVDFFIKHASKPAVTFSEKFKRTILRTCLDISLVSLGVVMAGTGNSKVFERACQLNARLSSDITYGNHLATSMTIGFLFLGGGRLTLSTSDKSIACLFCALYPKFPISATDNDFHMQAFRHLWVLSVSDRCLVTRDVYTQEPCCVPVVLEIRYPGSRGSLLKKSERISLVTPCTLPEISSIVSIEIDSCRYWPLKYSMKFNKDLFVKVLKFKQLFVKRKMGYLDYMQDPKGQKSVLASPFPNLFSTSEFNSENVYAQKDMEEFIKSFSQDPITLSFANNFCCLPRKNLTLKSYDMAAFCTSVLYDCLTQDKPEIIQTYLSIYQTVLQVLEEQGHGFREDDNQGQVLSIWNLKLVFENYANNFQASERFDNFEENISRKKLPLIQGLFLNNIKYNIDFKILEGKKDKQSLMVKNLENYIRNEECAQLSILFLIDYIFNCTDS
ncbi:Anaphase-promoting complex subunit 1, partial [Clydaea vesicula]